jgi:NAD(P)-dependent dehydrogenase (short-subunit alcohol dehydrogenase family)
MTPGPPPLAGRVALVTGATRGIGRAAALTLSAAGAHVIAAGRTQGALEALDDEARSTGAEPVTLVPMDLANGPGIDELGLSIQQRHGRLDILVHAAAMMGRLRPVAHIPPDLWDKILAVNLTSVFRLIRSLEPLLRASDAGRAIFFTASVAGHPEAFWGSYAATKAALEALVRCWADEVEVSNIRAVLVDPGAMRTRLRAEAYPGEEPDSLIDPISIGPLLAEIIGREDLGLPSKVVSFADWASARAAAAHGKP